MKVLMISTNFPSPAMPRVIGGAEVVTRRLAESLTADGVDVTVLRSAPPGERHPLERTGRIDVLSAAIRRPYWPFDENKRNSIAKLFWHLREDIGEVQDVRTIIDSVKPDIIHTQNISGLSTGSWRAAAAAGVPIVHTLHDYYLLCPRATRFRNGSVCITPCKDCRLVTARRRTDTGLVGDVVGVGHAVLEPHIASGLFAKARRHVVPNIISDELNNDRAPVSSSTTTFGFLGRITQEKGVELLVRAFASMLKPARLIIGGVIDDATRQRLQIMAGKRDITFVGFVKPADFFHQIDVLVVPSIWDDPLPTVILEGQTAGRPAIGSARGGIPEAIGTSGAGWTFDPDQGDSLRSLLDSVAGDHAAISQKARQASIAASRFRSRAIVDRYLAIYNLALDAKVEHGLQGS